MKTKYNIRIAALFFAVAALTSCGIYKSFNSIVTNKFPEVDRPKGGEFTEWNNDNFYILRIQLITDYTIHYKDEEDDDKVKTEIADFPMKDYKLLTQPKWDDPNVVEEVYMYLDGFAEHTDSSGVVIYMSSMPLSPDPSRLMFCNQEFVSTYAVNHLMTGHWNRYSDGRVEVDLNQGSNHLYLIGREEFGPISKGYPRIEYLEFEEVSHPKPLKENDKNSVIRAEDVFNVNPDNDTSSEVRGIRFFGYSNRDFVHFEWDGAPDTFSYKTEKDRCENNKNTQRINGFRLGLMEDKHPLYLRLSDNPDTEHQTVIGYER
jgi:hypothetical protein